MTSDNIKELKSKAKLMEPMIRIGKNGLTENAIIQIKKLIVKKKLIKVKLLRSFIESNDRKQAAKELAEKTGSTLIDQVGFVVVLYKR